ncbi:MAG TPA: hypothetical protein QF428_03120 [Flavobacteriaceae bacterium]|jgi:hypothetical protein|nr:hypothetical protein [Flavobacteriaceae bacterium]|tara:strand:+ start:44 stop:559 length:516 start_codon:yes stop_codon:yes gene_type:complete
MSIKVNIEKNNKDFQILEDNEVIIKGIKPKWYSQQIRFFYNNMTYEIKKKSFWSTGHIILRSGSLIGSIPFNWKKGHYIELDEHNEVKKQYWLGEKKKGGTSFDSDTIYTLLEGGTKSILEIHYSWKKWKEHMEIEILDKNDDSYKLLIYALFLMRQKQQAEASATTFVGG